MDDSELMAQVRARVGTVLKGKWTIDRVLGVGGMATVYAATHRNQKRVAIKMLHPDLSMHTEVRTRFLREGYAANTIAHRGAVAVDDDDITDEGFAFLVMELLEGETLETRRARKGGKLPPDEVLSLTDQLLDVLAAAHDKGVVHRDLKPDNLFFTHEGVLKVLDFGIARLREGSNEGTGRGGTRVGTLLGTPAFMAPEQARGRWEMVDGQTDIWAVGATMYKLLSGQFVREAQTVNEEIALAITTPVGSVAKVAPDLPKAVVEVVDKALAHEKAGRWSDARAMQVAVRLAYHAILGQGTGDAAGAEPSDAAGRALGADVAPRAVLPSAVEQAQTAAPIEPEVSPTKLEGAKSLARSPEAPRAKGKTAVVATAGVVAAAAIIGLVATRGGGTTAATQPAASAQAVDSARARPGGRDAPVATAEARPTTTASEATAKVEPAAEAPTAAPTATATATASAKATKPADKPTKPTKPVQQAADPFSRRY